MKYSLNVNHPLFKNLEDNPPQWWTNLIKDKDIYVDIRKGIPAGEGLRGATMQREDVKNCFDTIQSILLKEILKEQMTLYGDEEE